MSSAASTSPSAGFQCSSDCFRLRLPEKLLCRSLTHLLRLLRHVRLQYGFASRLACFCDPCRLGSAVRERRPCDGRGRFSVCHRAKPTEIGGKACNHLKRLACGFKRRFKILKWCLKCQYSEPNRLNSKVNNVLASRRATTGSSTGRRPCAMTDGGLTMLVLDSSGGREGAAARLNSR